MKIVLLVDVISLSLVVIKRTSTIGSSWWPLHQYIIPRFFVAVLNQWLSGLGRSPSKRAAEHISYLPILSGNGNGNALPRTIFWTLENSCTDEITSLEHRVQLAAGCNILLPSMYIYIRSQEQIPHAVYNLVKSHVSDIFAGAVGGLGFGGRELTIWLHTHMMHNVTCTITHKVQPLITIQSPICNWQSLSSYTNYNHSMFVFYHSTIYVELASCDKQLCVCTTPGFLMFGLAAADCTVWTEAEPSEGTAPPIGQSVPHKNYALSSLRCTDEACNMCAVQFSVVAMCETAAPLPTHTHTWCSRVFVWWFDSSFLQRSVREGWLLCVAGCGQHGCSPTHCSCWRMAAWCPGIAMNEWLEVQQRIGRWPFGERLTVFVLWLQRFVGQHLSCTPFSRGGVNQAETWFFGGAGLVLKQFSLHCWEPTSKVIKATKNVLCIATTKGTTCRGLHIVSSILKASSINWSPTCTLHNPKNIAWGTGMGVKITTHWGTRVWDKSSLDGKRSNLAPSVFQSCHMQSWSRMQPLQQFCNACFGGDQARVWCTCNIQTHLINISCKLDGTEVFSTHIIWLHFLAVKKPAKLRVERNSVCMLHFHHVLLICKRLSNAGLCCATFLQRSVHLVTPDGNVGVSIRAWLAHQEDSIWITKVLVELCFCVVTEAARQGDTPEPKPTLFDGVSFHHMLQLIDVCNLQWKL